MPFDLHPDLDVLVLAESGEKIGTMKVRQARDLARQQDLDLIIVSEQSSMTVCKIMDEGKWRYEQKKKRKHLQKKTPPLKEVKFGILTQQHDIDVKVKHIREFLKKGSPVKISFEMRGREKSHSDVAKEKLAGIITSLGDSIRPGDVKATSNSVFMIIQPARIKNGEGTESNTESSDRQLLCARREIHNQRRAN